MAMTNWKREKSFTKIDGPILPTYYTNWMNGDMIKKNSRKEIIKVSSIGSQSDALEERTEMTHWQIPKSKLRKCCIVKINSIPEFIHLREMVHHFNDLDH